MKALLFGLVFVPSLAFAADLPPQDFMLQVLQSIQSLGGLAGAAKIAAIITLVIASLKVSALRDMFWSKLGYGQVFMAPVLGLIAGGIAYFSSGVALTAPNIFAYMFAGSGAILFHELLDGVKGIPGLGSMYVSIIDFVSVMLGGKPTTPSA